jgi:DNA recombination protein RmuC
VETILLVSLIVLIIILLISGVVLIVMLRGVSKRMSMLEHQQKQINQRTVETDTITRGLAETTSTIRENLARAQENIAAIQAYSKARQELEFRTSESIRRLEAVIAGTQTKGAAGENIIEVVFSQLPADWQVRDFKVGNKTVEFGLRLPNNLVLPIDSKWTATDLFDRFLATDDVNEQQKLKSQIEKAVLSKAREVRKYIDPNVTVDFGIAAVPDAIFDLCAGVQVVSLQMNVVLISYSLFMPYLLLVFQTILKTSQNIDLQRLISHLESAQSNISELQKELEGRFSRAITMLNNSRDHMRVMLSKVSSGLTSLQISSVAETPELTEKASRPALGGG